MRILILGGDGMLGHQLLLQYRPAHEVCVTLRQDLPAYGGGLFTPENSYAGVDVRSTDRLAEVLADFRPQAVVNAVGIVKQRSAAHQAIPSLEINALLPHRLAVLCKACGARLIQMSTDCIFSGAKGRYTEKDPSDAADLYGKSKFLGELAEAHCVTFRTSIIGLELSRFQGLVEWFLAQRGAILGFRRAIYSGLTTMEMGRVIERVLTRHAELSGVFHVTAAAISKCDLLCALSRKLGRTDVEIRPDEAFACDRSLDGSRFAQATGYAAPSWDAMLDELAGLIRQRGNQP